MAFVSGETILSLIGKASLYLRFRDREKVRHELVKKYEGQFHNAGMVLLFDLLMALLAVAVVGLLAGTIFFVATKANS
ncbi:hypothetical protein [Pontibacter harenae]|uniref:hypothetical protein n=1 Tax=Pontibacter harenae TaxID=2894083 RepID=UPI001E5B823F|nr:hypothetical protein [Pontibacter harenae]MCC9166073.1 hypothetical protein [Pontibacter harenae]